MEENADLFPELPSNSQKNDKISEQTICGDKKLFHTLLKIIHSSKKNNRIIQILYRVVGLKLLKRTLEKY